MYSGATHIGFPMCTNGMRLNRRGVMPRYIIQLLRQLKCSITYKVVSGESVSPATAWKLLIEKGKKI